MRQRWQTEGLRFPDSDVERAAKVARMLVEAGALDAVVAPDETRRLKIVETREAEDAAVVARDEQPGASSWRPFWLKRPAAYAGLCAKAAKCYVFPRADKRKNRPR